MQSEMISGPDLGGGYLHQLSIDRADNRTTFTYHAQEGAADANGPPIGPLDDFGFTHPPSPCQFGGPRCWHRRFLLPFAETPKVRQAYNRNRFVLDEMLGQRFANRAAAVDGALAEIVRRVAPTLAAEGIAWFIGGSMAARLLGAAIRPRDIDLGTTRAGVDRLAALLAEYLIEPIAPTDWPRSGIVRGARAFVGTFHEGARVEWAVPIEPGLSRPLGEWSGEPGGVRLLPVTAHGAAVSVSRPEYALVHAAEQDAADRMGELTEIIRTLGPDLELLEGLLSRAQLPGKVAEAVRQSVRP